MSVRILCRVFFVSVFFKELCDRVGMHDILVILDTLNQTLQFSVYFIESRVFNKKFLIVYTQSYILNKCEIYNVRVCVVFIFTIILHMYSRNVPAIDCEFFVVQTSEPFYFLLFLPCLPSCLSTYKRGFLCPYFFFWLIKHKCLYYFVISILSSDFLYVSWGLVVCKDTNDKFNINTHTYQYNQNFITKS